MADMGIRNGGSYFFLGTFDHPEDGGRAYDEAARRHYGDQAVTNFPLVQSP